MILSRDFVKKLVGRKPPGGPGDRSKVFFDENTPAKASAYKKAEKKITQFPGFPKLGAGVVVKDFFWTIFS